MVVINVDTEGPVDIAVGSTWSRIEDEVKRALRERASFRDDLGHRPLFTWFLTNWLHEASRHNRPRTPHAVLDTYRRLLDGQPDELGWHYHHAWRSDTEDICRDWRSNRLYDEVFGRQLLDRAFYPSVYRAGHTWEDADSSAWLEQWIPFDYSNRSPMRGGNYDWSRAPRRWTGYHPSSQDPQLPGSQRRMMLRSAAIERGQLTDAEVEAAFVTAGRAGHSVLSWFTHDYRALTEHAVAGLARTMRVAIDFPDIRVVFATASEAARASAGLIESDPLSLEVSREGPRVVVDANRPIFSTRPWLAIERDRGRIERVDPVESRPCQWVFRISEGYLSAAVGAVTLDGSSCVRAVA